MPQFPMPLEAVNRLAVEAFVAAFGDIAEHSPWVAEQAAKAQPFTDRGAMAGLPMPVLVVTGQGDTCAGSPDGLAQAFAQGHAVTVPGCDHFSAIPHALTKAAVCDFLDGLLDDDFPPFE